MATNLAKRRYNIQKWHAKKRNIGWNITFEEWYEWWLNNGIDKQDQIGQHKDGHQKCMCRFNDQGSYCLTNIYCSSGIGNSSDYYKHNPQHGTKRIMTPKGVFQSGQEAALEYQVVYTTMSRWLKKKPTEFYYL